MSALHAKLFGRLWNGSLHSWNGSKLRFAYFEPVQPVFLRKLGGQGVKSASPTREARPLTSHLAPSNLNSAFAKA
jgi:hypothetical protein